MVFHVPKDSVMSKIGTLLYKGQPIAMQVSSLEAAKKILKTTSKSVEAENARAYAKAWVGLHAVSNLSSNDSSQFPSCTVDDAPGPSVSKHDVVKTVMSAPGHGQLIPVISTFSPDSKLHDQPSISFSHFKFESVYAA